MIQQQRGDLPRQTEGQPPDEHPRFLPRLIDVWMEQFEAERNAKRDGEARSGKVLWASDAGSCARRLQYDIRHRRGEIEPTNPYTSADNFRFAIGSLLHDALESAIAIAFPGSEAEVRGSVGDLSFRADAVIHHEGKVIAGEWKTAGGWSYKRMATSGKASAEGPRLSAFLQGAIAATELNADELVVGYIATELLSPAEATRQNMSETGRYCSEWSFLPDQFVPAARAELERMATILQATDEGLAVPRVIPGITPLGASVVDPSSGRWELRTPDGLAILDSGSAWPCNGYCSFAKLCDADCKAGR